MCIWTIDFLFLTVTVYAIIMAYGHAISKYVNANTDYTSSSYESSNLIRAKSKLGFFENLSTKLAEQRLSGKAFAVRNIINSKALVRHIQFAFCFLQFCSLDVNSCIRLHTIRIVLCCYNRFNHSIVTTVGCISSNGSSEYIVITLLWRQMNWKVLSTNSNGFLFQEQQNWKW